MSVSSITEKSKILKQRIQRGRRRWFIGWILFFLMVGLVALLALISWRQAARRQLTASVQFPVSMTKEDLPCQFYVNCKNTLINMELSIRS